jgi:SpoVK/Ycf46/Vps4 family AAA+-type ATPase
MLLTTDPAVIAALEAAVASDPGNFALRLHLAGLLVDDEPARALAHCQQILVDEPHRVDALRLAARAARAEDNETLAAAYDALAGGAGTEAEAPNARADQPAPVAAGPSPLGPSANPAFDAELEALLRNAASDGVDIEAPGMTLADVGGLDDVKRQIELSFLGPMRNPELRQMYGKSLRGGLLLYGPPGCGKTFLARAIAGELDANFYAIGLHEVLDMWLGQSEQNLHEVFERARANTPCVLFLDEVDALGQKRSQLTHSAGRNVVVQLLSELDGMGADNEGIFVLAATNQPWDVDPALRRPGRLDRTILVVPPDEDARRKILEVHLRDKPVEGVDFRRIAARTDGYSGADLRLVCEAAAELAIEDSLQQGRPRPIGQDDLVTALARATPSTRSWFDMARNVVAFANDGGEYDDLKSYMRKRRLL